MDTVNPLEPQCFRPREIRAMTPPGRKTLEPPATVPLAYIRMWHAAA